MQSGRADVRAIQEKYTAAEYGARVAEQWAVFDASFALVEKNKAALGQAYGEIKMCHSDAKAICDDDSLPAVQRQETLLRIIDAYFAPQAALPRAMRSKLRVNHYMAKMHRVVKRGGEGPFSFWIRFAKKGLVPMLVFLVGELMFLGVFSDQQPFWQTLLGAGLFLGGFGVYMFYAVDAETDRVYTSLRRWVRFKASPAEQERPSDMLQYLKMLAPLAVAFGSGFIKLYFRQ